MKSKFKIAITCLVLIAVTYSVIPKTYFHSLVIYKRNVLGYFNPDFEVDKNEKNKDFNFEKNNTPVYYSVFKFILNFLPINSNKEISCSFSRNQRFSVGNSFSFLNVKLII